MFRRKQHPSIEVRRLTSLVAEGVEIQGDVFISDGLRVDGSIQGSVCARGGQGGLLVVSEKGSIRGSVKVHDAVINGTIHGDLEVGHFVELQSKARITGNILYRKLYMECGATVEGRLECVEGAVVEREDVGKVVNLPTPCTRTAGAAES
ncbi:MAG: polymer-forming cytoskeletal protein [Steroidobacteraceae bacterium]|jgi:cytoskeletal protein CcmA (bactofilin family)|nr:polymer-forming cytoskeletal protein [Steroidobacteraceae bacterium]